MTWLIAAIIASQLILLIAIVRPSGTLLWLDIGMIAILVAYLVALCLGLIAFAKKNNPGK